MSAYAQIWKPVSNGFGYSQGIGDIAYDSLTNTLIAGGTLDSIGSVTVHNIARWNGYTWSAIGSNLPVPVGLVIVFNNELFVSSGATGSNHKIYKWDGASWNVFANPNGEVQCFKVHSGKLYIGGKFTSISGTTAKRIAVWDGSNWGEIGGGITQSSCCAYVQSIEFIDTILYVAGGFSQVGGSVPTQNIAGWNGTNWFPLGIGVNAGYPYSLKEFNNELYVGGNFTWVGFLCSNIAKWDGTNWFLVGDGFNAPVNSFIEFNNTLYASGWFDHSGTTFTGMVSKLDINGTWDIVGDGLYFANAFYMEIYNDEIYVVMGGNIPYGTDSIRNIARFGKINIESTSSACGVICNGTATAIDSVGVTLHTYLWSDGQTERTAVGLCPDTYTVSVTDGGGSITEASVTVGGSSLISTSIFQSICNGEVFDFNGAILSVTGIYSDTLNAINSCDSIINLNLSVLNSSASSITENICAGDIFNFNGANLNSTGIYTDTINAINSCDSIITLNLTVDTINTTIQQTNDTLSVSCIGSIQWFDCNAQQIIFGATTNIFIAPSTGSYAAIITEGNCVDTTVCKNVVTGINQTATNTNQFSIFPNPVTDELIIQLNSSNNNCKIEITNVLGVKVSNFGFGVSSSSTTINLKSFSSGIYFVRVSNEHWSEVQRIIKH